MLATEAKLWEEKAVIFKSRMAATGDNLMLDVE